MEVTKDFQSLLYNPLFAELVRHLIDEHQKVYNNPGMHLH